MRYLVAVLMLCASCFGTNHYICPSASGAGTGADWTNAYTAIGSGAGKINPASMVRGDTYYLANGQISSAGSTITFSSANSATSIITIQKATDTDHGTNTGWSNGGSGTCNSSQAVFGPIAFTTDYWTINGVYRGVGSEPIKSGYGVFINNESSPGTPVNSTAAITVGNAGGNAPNHDINLSYMEVQGSATVAAYGVAPADIAISISGGSSNNDYLGYNFFHDTGNQLLRLDSVQNIIVEHNTLLNDWGAGSHSECIAIRPWNSGNVGPLDIRYNFVENCVVAAFISDPSGVDLTGTSVWGIYGNVFVENTAEDTGCGGVGCRDASDGVMSLLTRASGATIRFYNNTIASFNTAGNAGIAENGTTTWYAALDVENNVWYNFNKGSGVPTCSSGATCTWLNNSYYASAAMCTADTTTTNKDCPSGNPFISPANTLNSNNYQLNGVDTASWHSLSSPYNQDPTGVTRTSSRGAYQFTNIPAATSGFFQNGAVIKNGAVIQ